MTFRKVLSFSFRISACVLVLTIIFGVLIDSSQGKKASNKKKAESSELDYIIVEAFPPPPVRAILHGPTSNKPKSKKSKKNRNGRQYYPDFYPSAYIEEDNQEVIINRPAKTGDSCFTPNGEDGTCVAMKKCFHYMYGNDLDGDGIYEGNLELANMIRKATTGTCKPDGPWKYIDGGIISIDGPENDLVCCTGNITQSQMSLEDKVVGGRVAKRGQFPFIVAIMNNGRHFCGGSLINSNHVLTAAHCIHHMGSNDVSRLTVQIGDHNIYTTRDGFSEVRRVARITKHRFFNPRNLYNDIAILTLAYGVPFNNLVQAVSLGNAGNGFATVAGWGKLSEYGTFPADLHFANVELWSNPRCRESYGNFAPGGIADHMVCAGSTRTDACFGDSGGPMTLNGRQIGIVSWGIGCGRFPGVYTRVSSFLDWIQRNQNR